MTQSIVQHIKRNPVLGTMAERILRDFWTVLEQSTQAVLLLDYDGTLAPFHVDRDKAFPYKGVRELLIQIKQTTKTRLVIISGRAVDDLLPLIDINPPPEVWGCHGWEKLDENGSRKDPGLPESAIFGLRKADLWVTEMSLNHFLEKKPASLAIHWRGLNKTDIDILEQRVREGWTPIAEESGLEIHRFNGGIELRCPGIDKGTAVSKIVQKLHKNVPIAFLGDDLTDEDAFEVLKGRGLGILVNDRPRKTFADVHIVPPADLLSFLERWLIHAPQNPF